MRSRVCASHWKMDAWSWPALWDPSSSPRGSRWSRRPTHVRAEGDPRRRCTCQQNRADTYRTKLSGPSALNHSARAAEKKRGMPPKGTQGGGGHVCAVNTNTQDRRSSAPRERPRPSTSEFAKFAGQLVLDNGKPFKIQPYQRLMLADYFAGATETVIVIPKKNGKTTLLSALALYHLWREPDAECVIVAASRDQARILFKQAAGLVLRSELAPKFDVKGGYGEIRLAGEKMGGRIRVLAADSATADGVIPTLALVDELRRHPSAELYGVFRDGLGPRDGQMLTISTAGATFASPLGRLRAKAHDGRWSCSIDGTPTETVSLRTR
jgi:Phage Terminase